MDYKKKMFLSLFFIMLLIPSVLAISVQVQKTSSNEVLVAELNKPVTFNVSITNLGPSDNFNFYTYDFSISPKTLYLDNGQTKNIQLQLTPLPGKVVKPGYMTINYFIKAASDTTGQQNENLTFKIINLKDAFEIGSGNVDPTSQTMSFYIKNLENYNFGAMNASFVSPFFKADETFSLGPKETRTFIVKLDKQNFMDLLAGFYTLDANINIGNVTAKVEGTIQFSEKNIVTTTTNNFGFFITNEIINKSNQGNAITTTEVVVKKNIISRLFTTLSPVPDNVDRQGAIVYYTWTQQLSPGKTLNVKVTTNWLFPFIAVIFIIAIVILVKKYTRATLALRKKVSFVRAKGGEFALRISIIVNARSYIERVNIIDRLPPLVKIYERFGAETPSRIDEKARKIEWNFDHLEPGETRILSYVIYSKVGVMGKFALPTARAIFEKDGEIQEAESNRAYFLTEQVTKNDEPEE